MSRAAALLLACPLLACNRTAPEPTKASASATPAGCPEGTRLVEGGSYRLEGSPVLSNVDKLCVDATEVTVDAYAACVSAGACSPPDAYDAATYPKAACNWKAPDRGKHPVNCVAYSQAEDFCRAAGKRLPSRDEWTWIARGGEKASTYPWGEDAPRADLLDACGTECPKYMASVHNDDAVAMGLTTMYEGDDGFGSTAPAGSFPKGATAEGVLDLAGNVAEWTSSIAHVEDASAGRYVAGGSWLDDVPAVVRADAAHFAPLDRRAVDVGFRCVKNF